MNHKITRLKNPLFNTINMSPSFHRRHKVSRMKSEYLKLRQIMKVLNDLEQRAVWKILTAKHDPYELLNINNCIHTKKLQKVVDFYANIFKGKNFGQLSCVAEAFNRLVTTAIIFVTENPNRAKRKQLLRQMQKEQEDIARLLMVAH
ncbi:MAG: hypothetical protein ACRYGG_06120 [Janthinobacterium lividum]